MWSADSGQREGAHVWRSDDDDDDDDKTSQRWSRTAWKLKEGTSGGSCRGSRS
jgi:hypothetical protein